jgi:glycosyltransferase involved in cell wall biosynthesis
VLPLSVAIVCRNNEATIERTLESVRGLAAEVVAVDSGSTDGTIPLLERHGARVIRSQWRGFVATKQMALSECRQLWILSLDSDESLTPELRRSIEETLGGGGQGPRADGYRVNRKVYYRGRPLNHVWQPEHRLRLVRQGRARWTGLDPHDKLELVSACGGSSVVPPLLAGDLRHDSVPTFSEFMAKQAGHARVMAESLAAAGERGSVLRMIVSPPGAFLKQVVLKRAWRDGWPGWLAAASVAGATLMKHMALIERTRGDAGRP